MYARKTHLQFPVRESLCRSVGCDRARNRARGRGWALLNTSYSNTTSACPTARSCSHNLSFQAAPPPPRLLLFSPSPHPLPSSASSPLPLLPPPSSSYAVCKPCSLSKSLSCPGNGARLDALASHHTVAFLPDILGTVAVAWKLELTVGQTARSYLAELVQLLKTANCEQRLKNKKISKKKHQLWTAGTLLLSIGFIFILGVWCLDGAVTDTHKMPNLSE